MEADILSQIKVANGAIYQHSADNDLSSPSNLYEEGFEGLAGNSFNSLDF